MGLMLAARVVKKSLRKSRASCGEQGDQIQRPGGGGGGRGSGLGSGSDPTWPAHLVHVEPQGQQRDAEAALGTPQVGHGGHVQRFDLELKAGGELWAPLGLRPPPPQCSPSWSCRGRSLSEARL